MGTFPWHGLQGLHGYTWLSASFRSPPEAAPKAYGLKPTAPHMQHREETEMSLPSLTTSSGPLELKTRPCRQQPV